MPVGIEAKATHTRGLPPRLLGQPLAQPDQREQIAGGRGVAPPQPLGSPPATTVSASRCGGSVTRRPAGEAHASRDVAAGGQVGLGVDRALPLISTEVRAGCDPAAGLDGSGPAGALLRAPRSASRPQWLYCQGYLAACPRGFRCSPPVVSRSARVPMSSRACCPR